MKNSMIRTLVLLALALTVPACGGKPDHSSSQALKTPDRDIETFPSEGSEHVPVGTQITYLTDPPTSGSHYAEFLAEGGFYTTEINPPYVVHSMEHGGIIIYYSPQVTPEQLDRLR